MAGFAGATLISAFYRFTEERLALSWRQWMTQHLLKRYFHSRNYYKLLGRPDIDNPDQRISEDVHNFTATSLSLLLILVNSVITIIAFIGVLSSISYSLVFVLIAYAFFGTLLTVLVGSRLVRLHYKQYNREGTFRHGLIRVRDNAESIAFFRGEARERINLLQRFAAIFGNTKKLIVWNRNLSFFTTGYNYLALIIPTLVAAPLYLTGQIEFGVITQAAGAFGQVLAAFSVAITQFERLSAYAAGVTRIESLWDFLDASKLEDVDDDPEIVVEQGKSLELDKLTVITPGAKKQLVTELSLIVKPGQGLLIMGESGVGKSSILRTVAGLWSGGTGNIIRPQLRQMMFMPQRPYMPNGTLRSQLIYPTRKLAETDSDESIRDILKQVNLTSLLERDENILERHLDWASVLSIGEQQRISFARLFYHNPLLAFLDEATSALDEENEEYLYRLVLKLGFSFISVGHRSTLKKYHSQILEIRKDGTWDISDSKEFTTG